MPELHQLVTEDSRPFIDRIRRVDLEMICQKLELKYDATAGAELLRQQIKANGVDDAKLAELVGVLNVQQNQANGSAKQVVYPARQQIKDVDYDYASKIEETGKQSVQEDLKDIVRQQAEQIEQLLALKGQANVDNSWQQNPEKMHGKTLQKKLRELGLPVKRTDTKQQLLEKFYGYKNAT